ncbi:MAG: AsmA family protein [Kiritimatiellia bacterium]
MKRVLKYALIAVVALVLIVSVCAHALAKKAIAWAVERETGLGIRIGGLKMGKFSPWFEITDLRLMNPSDFADEPCVHIAKLHVKYNPVSLFSGSVEIPSLYLDIPRVLIVEEEGKSNLDPLVEKRLSQTMPAAPEPGESVAAAPSGAARSVPAAPELKSGHKNVNIGSLELKLGMLELRRRGAGEREPVVQEFVFDETYVFTNVAGTEQIVQRIAASFFVKQMSAGAPAP